MNGTLPGLLALPGVPGEGSVGETGQGWPLAPPVVAGRLFAAPAQGAREEPVKPWLKVRRLTWGQTLAAWFLRRATVDGERLRFRGWLPFRAFRDYDEGPDTIYYAPRWYPRNAQGHVSWNALRWYSVDGPLRLRRRGLFLHEAWWHDPKRGDDYQPGHRGHASTGIGAASFWRRTLPPSQVARAWDDLEDWYAGVDFQGGP